MAKNTRKTHKNTVFFDFSSQFTPKKVHGRGFQKVDLTNNVLYRRGAPIRRAPAVAYMENY